MGEKMNSRQRSPVHPRTDVPTDICIRRSITTEGDTIFDTDDKKALTATSTYEVEMTEGMSALTREAPARTGTWRVCDIRAGTQYTHYRSQKYTPACPRMRMQLSIYDLKHKHLPQTHGYRGIYATSGS